MLATFYLVCFLVGIALSVVSFVGGGLHFAHLHLPLPHGHPDIPHLGTASHAGAGNDAAFPYVNFFTITTFLAWFGGTGLLLTRHSTLVVMAIMLIAIAAGLLGAAIIFWFIAKLVLGHDRELDPADYDRVGVLGRISSPIREGGTGEIIFSQAGTRQTCGARSENGEALPRGTEVIVTRYEHGIAYVRRWEDLADGRQATAEE